MYVSDLPGCTPPTKIGKQYQEDDGSWFGFSEHGLPLEDPDAPPVSLIVGHLLYDAGKPSDPSAEWLGKAAIAHNVICVRAFLDGTLVASARFKRYGCAGPNGGVASLKHPLVWESEQTWTDEEYRGRGIASAMYSHVHAFKYPISPSYGKRRRQATASRFSGVFGW